MFIRNGFVCGGESENATKIISAQALPDQMMLIVFNNGEERLFDASILSGPVFEPLRIESVFINFTIDHGVITWCNGEIDCAPEFMYRNSYEYLRDTYCIM